MSDEKKINDMPEDILPENLVTEETMETDAKKAERHTSKRRKKGVLRYIIIAIIILIGVRAGFEFFNSGVVEENETEIAGQIELDTSSKHDFISFNKCVVMADKYGLYAYDKTGKVKWTYETNITTPVLYQKGKRLMLTDTVQNISRVFDSKGKLEYEVNYESDCINATLNENGWITAILRLKGYRAKVAVYDNAGQLRYAWNSANNDVVAASLAKDNKTLAVAQIDSISSAEANGVISLFDITKEGKPYSGKNILSNLVSYIRWSGDKLICVGSESTFKIDKNGNDIWNYEYPGEVLLYNAKDDSIFVFVTNGNSTSSSKVANIYTINDDGKQLGMTELEGEIRAVDIKSSSVYVIGANNITVLNRNAKQNSKNVFTRDISRGIIFEEKNNAFVVSGTSAQIIPIK